MPVFRSLCSSDNHFCTKSIQYLYSYSIVLNKEKKVAEVDLPRLAGHPKDGGETGLAIHYSSDFQFSGYIIISALGNTAIYTDIKLV